MQVQVEVQQVYQEITPPFPPIISLRFLFLNTYQEFHQNFLQQLKKHTQRILEFIWIYLVKLVQDFLVRLLYWCFRNSSNNNSKDFFMISFRDLYSDSSRDFHRGSSVKLFAGIHTLFANVMAFSDSCRRNYFIGLCRMCCRDSGMLLESLFCVSGFVSSR